MKTERASRIALGPFEEGRGEVGVLEGPSLALGGKLSAIQTREGSKGSFDGQAWGLGSDLEGRGSRIRGGASESGFAGAGCAFDT